MGFFGIFYITRWYILLLISIEILILSICLNFIIISIFLDNIIGQLFSIYILTISAIEITIGITLILLYSQYKANYSFEILYLKKYDLKK